jgi:hypothetical protein
MRNAMVKLAIGLVIFIAGSLAPGAESQAQRQRGISQGITSPRLTRPPRVPRIRRYAPLRKARPLSERENERLKQTEDFIGRQSLPGSICRGC